MCSSDIAGLSSLAPLERLGAPLWRRLQPLAAKALRGRSAYLAEIGKPVYDGTPTEIRGAVLFYKQNGGDDSLGPAKSLRTVYLPYAVRLRR